MPVGLRRPVRLKARGPTFWEQLAHERQDAESEVRNAGPGKDQNAGIAGCKGRILDARSRRPSDGAFEGSQLLGGGAEAEHGDEPSSAVMDCAAILLPDPAPAAEIVPTCDELVPVCALPDAAHDNADVNRAHLVEAGYPLPNDDP